MTAPRTPEINQDADLEQDAAAWQALATILDQTEPAELDQRATDFLRLHRADDYGIVVRLKWKVLPWPALRLPRCVFCHRPWICPPAQWAYQWTSGFGPLLRQLDTEVATRYLRRDH